MQVSPSRAEIKGEQEMYRSTVHKIVRKLGN